MHTTKTYAIRRVGTRVGDTPQGHEALRAWVIDERNRVKQWASRGAAEHHAECIARYNPQWQYVVVAWSKPTWFAK